MGSASSVSATSAIVLAGGGSSRLGRNKAFLEVKGQLLLERIIRRLQEVSEEIIIVASEADRYREFEATVIGDAYPGTGSLGGIYTGVKQASNSHSLVVACDMPFLDPSLLRYIQTLSPSYDVVMPRIGQHTEALHAVYSQACIPFMEKQLQNGDLRIIHFLPQVRVRYVEQEEIEIFDPEHLSFFNINTEADVEKARQIWSQEE